ncbi:MAG: hypothetical protein FJY39_10930, partial [Betaproteobacteria bacterium]|nr:hypothetical protein [Betaproteobacteria bacterium]
MLRTALRRDCLRTLARPLLLALLAGTDGGVVAQAGSGSGAAQATPSTLSTKSLRIIVPYAAGGPIDLSVR